jgi:hypothetical protein
MFSIPQRSIRSPLDLTPQLKQQFLKTLFEPAYGSSDNMAEIGAILSEQMDFNQLLLRLFSKPSPVKGPGRFYEVLAAIIKARTSNPSTSDSKLSPVSQPGSNKVTPIDYDMFISTSGTDVLEEHDFKCAMFAFPFVPMCFVEPIINWLEVSTDVDSASVEQFIS